jgi:hypothetical protein
MTIDHRSADSRTALAAGTSPAQGPNQRLRMNASLPGCLVALLPGCLGFLLPFCLSTMVLVSPASAQPGDTMVEKTEPLAAKQQMIRDRLKRLEDRMFQLREQLLKTEPDNAERLGRALERAGELGLEARLDEIIRLLQEGSSLPEASQAQAAWLEQADKVLAVLLRRDSENEQRKEEIDRLQEYRQELRDILKQQRAHRDASAKAANAARLLRLLDAALKRLDDLQKRQTDAARDSQQKDALNDEPSRVEAAGQQRDIARETQQLAEDVERLAELEPEEQADSTQQQEAREQAEQGAQALQEARRAMERAGQAAQQGERAQLQKDQQEAEENLRRARDRLLKAKEELQSQAPSDGESLAEKQRATADETRDLADRMQNDAESGGDSSEQSPGQESLDDAERDMRGAEQDLQQEQHEDANRKQQEAIRKLEQAQRELEDELNQLRKEDRQETLRDLESRFRDMLAGQREINEETVRLDRIGVGKFQRAEQLQVADLTSRQRELSERAATCLHILEEEGTTIVFPHIVEQLSEDMGVVSDRLAEALVGPLTQSIEEEVVETLEELIQATQRMQQENEQQGGPMPSGSELAPLLPTSAELKLLKASQQRVNTRTQVIDETRNSGEESEATLARSLEAAARRQLECAEIAREMRDRR